MNEILATLESHSLIQEFKKVEADSFEHNFKGFGVHPSTIMVHIYKHNGWNLVVLQDLAKGTSVTNASEHIATEVGKLKSLDPQKTIWLECYPYYGGDYDIDRIRYDYANGVYSNPEWEPVKNKVIVEFLRSVLPQIKKR